MSRRKAREHAVQALYALEMNESTTQEAIHNELYDTSGDKAFTEELVHGVLEHQIEIDKLIEEHIEGWKLERVGRVERAILRISIYEMNYNNKLAKNIVFNEAIEIARTFGDEATARFINGVLSRITA